MTKSATERVELLTYEFTKVKVFLVADEKGKLRKVAQRELVALKANPFWFAHHLFTPESVERGRPFTIGCVLHSSRGLGLVGYIGGVEMFLEALSSTEMLRLAGIASALIPGYWAGTSWAKVIHLARHDFQKLCCGTAVSFLFRREHSGRPGPL